MRLASITLLNDRRTEVDLRLRENAYSFSALRGWNIELDGAAVMLEHPERTGVLVIPFAQCERAELAPEVESTPAAPKAAPKAKAR